MNDSEKDLRSINTAPKPFVFVLMPFAEEFDDVYKIGIKQAANNAGAYAERVDEQIFTENILDRIYNQIAKADIVVSDMTGRNPNVYYETGYAHALNKDVILLTKNAEDIPFDLKHYPHIIYENKIAEILLPELTKKIHWFISNPSSKKNNFNTNLIPRIGLQSMLEETEFYAILERIKEEGGKEFILNLNIQNSVEQIISSQEFRINIITPTYISKSYIINDNQIPFENRTTSIGKALELRKLHLVADTFNLYPGEWENIKILFRSADSLLFGTRLQISIILLNESGKMEYPITLTLEESLI